MQKLFFLLALLSIGVSCSANYSSLNIYWGSSPKPSSPSLWNTVFIYSPKGSCTGALIQEDVVLTAAHCVEGIGPSNLVVRFGDAQGSIERQAAAITTLALEGAAFFPNFDLAKITLSSPAPEAYAPIPVGAIEPLDELLLAGFGVTEASCTDSPCETKLLEGKTDLDSIYNQAHAISLFTTHANQSKGDSAPCFGDSGGPVYTKRGDSWLLVGITNGVSLVHTPFAFEGKSKADCSKGWGLHTNLGGFADWLEGKQIISMIADDTGFNQWADWLADGDPSKTSWFTVDKLLRTLALQPTIQPTDITKLILDSNWSQQAVEKITALNIKSDLQGPKVVDLRPVATWKSLQTLSLNDAPVRDFRPLASMPALSRISIVCADQSYSFSGSYFEQLLKSLEPHLSLIGCSDEAIRSVGWHQKLLSLSISVQPGQALGDNFAPLKADSVRFSQGIIPSAFTMPDTPQLVIDNMGTIDVQEIRWQNPNAIRALTVRNTLVSDFNALGIRSSDNLIQLELKNTSTTEIVDLSGFTSLQNVAMTDNALLKMLPALPPSVTTLDISGTAIEDLSDLIGRSSLKIVALKMRIPDKLVCPEGVSQCVFDK